MSFIVGSMASEAPDPSSSELLTDFDIADVENWDDHNDNSKDISLVNMSTNYCDPSPNRFSKTITSHVETNAPGFSSLEQIGKLALLPQMSNQALPQAFPVQPNSQGSPANSHPPPHGHAQQHVSQEPAQSSGHALATLRALAQAQDEQARQLKEQEKARQEAQAKLIKEQELARLQEKKLQQEAKPLALKITTNSLDNLSISSNIVNSPVGNQDVLPQSQESGNETIVSSIVTNSVSSNAIAPSNINGSNNAANSSVKSDKPPIATLQLPYGDKKDGKYSKSYQLKGQLVRTPDQKLLLVTDVNGKKIAYVINPQSAAIAQKLAKSAQGGELAEIPIIKSPAYASGNGATTEVSTTGPTLALAQSVASANIKTVLPSHQAGGLNLTQMNWSDKPGGHVSVSMKSIAAATNNSKNDHSPVDNPGTASWKGKHLELATTTGGSQQKKRKIKEKKKKDANEPAKPLSPYLIFFKDIQPIMRQQNPSAGLGEVSKLVSQRWEQTSDEEKKVYIDRSIKAKEEYQVKLAEYRARLTAESPVGAPGEPRHTATTQPILIDSTSSGEDQPMDCSSNDVISGAAFSSPHDSRVCSDVTGQFATSNSQVEGGMNSAKYDGSIIELDDDVSNSDDMLSKKSRQKSGKKSKNRDKDEDIGSRRHKLLKLNSNSSTDGDEGVSQFAKSSKPKKNKSKNNKSSLTIESLKSPPKLTMKINIKDSKITESPTKSPMFEEDLRRQTSREVDENSAESDLKPSTQPKALQSFKIPLKKSSSPSDSKGGNEAANKRDPKTVGQRKCVVEECGKPAKVTRERGPLYCGDQCLVEHCRIAFQAWVSDRKLEASNT